MTAVCANITGRDFNYVDGIHECIHTRLVINFNGLDDIAFASRTRHLFLVGGITGSAPFSFYKSLMLKMAISEKHHKKVPELLTTQIVSAFFLFEQPRYQIDN